MIDRMLIVKLICVALVASVMLPAGTYLFPLLDGALSGTQFHAVEAVVSAGLGFGIFSLLG